MQTPITRSNTEYQYCGEFAKWGVNSDEWQQIDAVANK